VLQLAPTRPAVERQQARQQQWEARDGWVGLLPPHAACANQWCCGAVPVGGPAAPDEARVGRPAHTRGMERLGRWRALQLAKCGL